MGRRRSVVGGAVAAHLVVTLVHGWPHATIPVPIPPWQKLFVAVVLVIAPVAGFLAVARARPRLGGWLLLCSGLGALAVEGVCHFVVPNPDHVAAVDHGRFRFATTAALSTVGDGVLVVAGWYCSRRIGREERT